MAFVDIPQKILHHNTLRNADGTCQRWHINGRMKIWKREPHRFQIPVKRSLWEFMYVTEVNADQFHLEEDCGKAMSSGDVQTHSFRFEPTLGLGSSSPTNDNSGQGSYSLRTFSMPYPQADGARGLQTRGRRGLPRRD